MIISEQDFIELKRCFDMNDTYKGAEQLSWILQAYLEDSTRGNNYSQYIQYSEPRGLTTHEYYYNGQQVRGLGIDPMYMDKLEALPYAGDIHNMQHRIDDLEQQVRDLLAMHQEGADHIPTIISTREQLVEMQDQIEAEDEVVIKTSYDRAMEMFDANR